MCYYEVEAPGHLARYRVDSPIVRLKSLMTLPLMHDNHQAKGVCSCI